MNTAAHETGSARIMLRHQADFAWTELLGALEGISQEQAWGMITLQPGEYLHTEGSIQSIVLHIAGCKFLYGSCAFRKTEVRWRDVVARFEEFWPDWEAVKAY